MPLFFNLFFFQSLLTSFKYLNPLSLFNNTSTTEAFCIYFKIESGFVKFFNYLFINAIFNNYVSCVFINLYGIILSYYLPYPQYFLLTNVFMVASVNNLFYFFYGLVINLLYLYWPPRGTRAVDFCSRRGQKSSYVPEGDITIMSSFVLLCPVLSTGQNRSKPDIRHFFLRLCPVLSLCPVMSCFVLF